MNKFVEYLFMIFLWWTIQLSAATLNAQYHRISRGRKRFQPEIHLEKCRFQRVHPSMFSEMATKNNRSTITPTTIAELNDFSRSQELARAQLNHPTALTLTVGSSLFDLVHSWLFVYAKAIFALQLLMPAATFKLNEVERFCHCVKFNTILQCESNAASGFWIKFTLIFR